jgi:hypothetical protein
MTADLYLGRQSPFVSSPVKRLTMCTKGGIAATWTRMFDLLSLLVRSCVMADNVWRPPSVVAVVLGPVPSQRHGSSHLAQFIAGSRQWPAPLQWNLAGADNDVRACQAARKDQEARGRLPFGAMMTPTVPSAVMLPAIADVLPSPSLDDAAIMQRCCTYLDERRHAYLKAQPAAQKSIRPTHSVFVSLTNEVNMLQVCSIVRECALFCRAWRRFLIFSSSGLLARQNDGRIRRSGTSTRLYSYRP